MMRSFDVEALGAASSGCNRVAAAINVERRAWESAPGLRFDQIAQAQRRAARRG